VGKKSITLNYRRSAQHGPAPRVDEPTKYSHRSSCDRFASGKGMTARRRKLLSGRKIHALPQAPPGSHSRFGRISQNPRPLRNQSSKIRSAAKIPAPAANHSRGWPPSSHRSETGRLNLPNRPVAGP
jgi:hypothetical protein